METNYPDGPWEYCSQMGVPGHCSCAQVFDSEGNAIIMVEPTEEAAKATSIARLVSKAPDMLDMLLEAKIQIAYLHQKFEETGSGNSVMSRIDTLIEQCMK